MSIMCAFCDATVEGVEGAIAAGWIPCYGDAATEQEVSDPVCEVCKVHRLVWTEDDGYELPVKAMKDFQFEPKVRKHVKALTELMEFANAQDQPGGLYGKWAWQTGGVYGAAHDGVMRIIAEVCGQQVADRVDFNFGGDSTWLDDVEASITETMEELAEEMIVEAIKDDRAKQCREV